MIQSSSYNTVHLVPPQQCSTPERDTVVTVRHRQHNPQRSDGGVGWRIRHRCLVKLFLEAWPQMIRLEGQRTDAQ